MRSVIVLIAICISINSKWAQTKDAIKWREPENITEQDRFARTPGTIGFLEAVGQFFKKITATQPDFSVCAYPLLYKSALYDSEMSHKEYIGNYEKEKQNPSNRMRYYIYDINSATATRLYDNVADIPIPLKSKPAMDKAQAVTKKHKCAGLGVTINVSLKSLQSKKVEEDVQFFMILAYTDNIYRVIVFNEL